MNVAYVRVSTAEQNEARQVEALRSHNIDKWFTEKISGKNTHRPQLQAMLDFVREGDTVYIHDFSRLARSTKDLLELVESCGLGAVGLCGLICGVYATGPQRSPVPGERTGETD